MRPTDPGWPSAERRDLLRKNLEGELIAVSSPLKNCAAGNADCGALFKELKNPYLIGDHVGLTQTLG